MPSYEDLVKQLTSKGGPFEIATEEVFGRPMKVFKDTPPSLNSLLELARSHGESPFLIYQDRRLSFSQVLESADRLATALYKNFQVKPKDRVAIAMRNVPEWIISFKAVVSLGCTVVPLNSWWTTKELRYGLGNSGAQVILCDEERARRLIEPGPSADPYKIIALASKDPYTREVFSFETLLKEEIDLPPIDISLDDDVTLFYTSGTTDKPKGAVSTNRSTISALMGFSLRSTINDIVNPTLSPLEFPPSVLVGVPLFHITGFIVMLSAFISGSKLSLMHRWDPNDALRIIEKESVTNFVGVPTMSWDILEASRQSPRDLSSLQSIGGGGSPVPPKLVKRISEELRSTTPGFGYGLTETNAFGPAIGGQDLISHPTSTGRTLPIVELKIIGTDERSLAANQEGEICIRGVPLAQGYWMAESQSIEAFPEGWLHTGDIGYLDEDGYLYIKDRVKDMVIRGGENIFCAEVEAAIYEHPNVHEAAVFGVPDRRLGERVAAQICAKKGQQLSVQELQSFLAARLAYFKIPELYNITEEPLARGATGKILKREIKQQFPSFLKHSKLDTSNDE